MISLTQRLRDERRDLLPHMEMLRAVADEIGEAREEEVYLPLLDAHLTPEEAARMFEAMEAEVSI